MSAYAWVIWDALALAVLCFFANFCARKGFVRTLVDFFGYAIAAMLAGKLSPWCARILYDNVVYDVLRRVIGSRAAGIAEQGGVAASDVLEGMPALLTHMMEQKNSELLALLQEVAAGDLVDAVIRLALENPMRSILQSLCFLILFALFCFLVRRLSRVLSVVYKLPLVGPLNTLLGGLLGMMQAVLFLYISGFLLEIAILWTGGGWAFCNARVLGDTYIYRVFLHFSA